MAKLGFGDEVRGNFTLGSTFSYWTGGNVEVLGELLDINFVNGAKDFDPDIAQDIQVNDNFVNQVGFGGAIGGGGVQVNVGVRSTQY